MFYNWNNVCCAAIFPWVASPVLCRPGFGAQQHWYRRWKTDPWILWGSVGSVIILLRQLWNLVILCFRFRLSKYNNFHNKITIFTNVKGKSKIYSKWPWCCGARGRSGRLCLSSTCAPYWWGTPPARQCPRAASRAGTFRQWHQYCQMLGIGYKTFRTSSLEQNRFRVHKFKLEETSYIRLSSILPFIHQSFSHGSQTRKEIIRR